MTQEASGPIRPRSVPLSHTRTDPPVQSPAGPRLPIGWLAIILTLFALLIGVFYGLPKLMERPPEGTVAGDAALATDAGGTADAPPAGAAAPRDAPVDDDRPPPFATLMREQAREGAQAQLTSFVEKQLALEQEMQVGAWGSTELDAAKAKATRGDELFVANQFEQSLEAYREATQRLTALMEKGREIVEKAIARGTQALDERDQALAIASFKEALEIDSDNSTALSGLQRAERLPAVIEELRRGKNLELAGRWQEALSSYERTCS